MGRLLFFREREYYVPVKKVDHISTLVVYIYLLGNIAQKGHYESHTVTGECVFHRTFVPH